MPSWIGPWEILMIFGPVVIIVVLIVVFAVHHSRRQPAPRSGSPLQGTGYASPPGAPAYGSACSVCGIALPQNSAFCNACGAPVQRDPSMVRLDANPTGFCRQCGKELRPEDLFCVSCGAPAARSDADDDAGFEGGQA